MEFKGDGGLGFYSVKVGEGMGLLMLSPMPAPIGAEQITPMLEMMKTTFLKEAKKNEALAKIELREGGKPQILKGKVFRGEYVVFELGGVAKGRLQTMFLMSDGEKLWNGQFSGGAADWKKALRVLEKMGKAEVQQ